MKINTNVGPFNDQLSSETFVCCQCGKPCSVTEGSWLPVAVEKKKPVPVLKGSVKRPPMLLGLNLRKPEVITSTDFTCYDCQ